MATEICCVLDTDLGSTIRVGSLTSEPDKLNVDFSNAPNQISDFRLEDKRIELVTKDQVFSVNLDLLVDEGMSVKADNYTIVGEGTSSDPLAVNLSNDSDSLLKHVGDGIAVLGSDVETVALKKDVELAKKLTRDIKLTNVTGQTVIGYLYSTESTSAA